MRRLLDELKLPIDDSVMQKMSGALSNEALQVASNAQCKLQHVIECHRRMGEQTTLTLNTLTCFGLIGSEEHRGNVVALFEYFLPRLATLSQLISLVRSNIVTKVSN